MTERDHPTPGELQGLVDRTLDAVEGHPALMEHLSRCDECFQAYESLWIEASSDLPDLAEVYLDPVAIGHLQYRLFQRIHVASLATSTSWLVTEGFLRVILGMLLPIVETEREPNWRARGERP